MRQTAKESAQKNKIDNNVGNYDIVEGKYILHNGVEFGTLDEVNAFIKGLEFAKANANIGMDTVIENSMHSLKDMEI